MREIGLSIWCFLALICSGYDCVQILSMTVPEAVEAGSEDIVLHCDFTYTEEEKNHLVVKWYFNNEPEPIYQWIVSDPNKKGGQLISDLFRGHINDEFVVYDEDSFMKHRLHIKNPLPKFSGTYTCQVSSLVDYDSAQKNLLIYDSAISSEVDESYYDSLLNKSYYGNAENVPVNASYYEDGIGEETPEYYYEDGIGEETPEYYYEDGIGEETPEYQQLNDSLRLGDLRLFKRINNGYRGGAMVKIGQRYFTVEPKSSFNVSLVLLDLESDANLESQYEEIEIPIGGPGLFIRPGMYLTDLGVGPEMILVYYDNDNRNLVGLKLSGDTFVPADEINFVIDLAFVNGSMTFATPGYTNPYQVEASLLIQTPTEFHLRLGKRVEEYEDDGSVYDYDYGANSPPDEYRMVDLMEEYLRVVGDMSEEEKRADIFGRNAIYGHMGGAMMEIEGRWFTVEADSLWSVALVPVDLDSWSDAEYDKYDLVDIASTGVEGLPAGLYVADIAGPEIIAVTGSNNMENVVGIKLTGDSTVPAGQINFEVDRRSLNGSINCAYPNYVDPFRVEAYIEIASNSSFDVHNAEFVYDGWTVGPDAIKCEYHRIDLMKQYAKAIESENNLEEIATLEGTNEMHNYDPMDYGDFDEMADYGESNYGDENLDDMYEYEDMTGAVCPGCSLATLSSRFSLSETGTKPDVQSEITHQREELTRLRLALQNKEQEIETLNINIENLDKDINEALNTTSRMSRVDEVISEMKEDKIRQVALIEDLESGKVLADCQKKSSVKEQRLARLVSLTENYHSIIGIEDEHHNSMQLIANDNVMFANLYKGLLERQAQQNQRCQTTLNEQNENMEQLENEEKNVVDEKMLIQREFENQRARIETNIEREKSLRNVIENQKNTIEANQKKISILKKTVSALSLHVPDCNITMVDDSDSELDFDYQISDLRSFNEESLTAYMDMTAALQEKLDAQNESFTICQESRRINVEELGSLSHLQSFSIHKIIKEVNSLSPPDRQLVVPDVPVMSSLPQPPRNSQLQLHAITLSCPSNYRGSSATTIPYVDGHFVLPSFWPTCERKLTLRGGIRPSEGNVFFNGSPVCDDKWSISEANVACRELGFPLGAVRATKESYFGSVSSSFGMDDVNCNGDEASLEDCYYKNYDDCGGSEGAGVVCKEDGRHYAEAYAE